MTKTSRAISTPHHLATEAGRRMFEAGGSAVDAAIAADAVLAVVYPHNTAIGGDLIALVTTPGAPEPALVDAFGYAPRDVRPAQWGTSGRVPASGPPSITVPGTLRGWRHLHDAHGRLPWDTLLEPAITAARDGYPISRSLRGAIDRAAASGAEGRDFVEAFFGPEWETATTASNPALARTLTRLAAAGPDDFYTGEVAAAVLAYLRSVRPEFTAADLADYAVRTTEPLSTAFGGYTVHTGGAPCQGFALLRYLDELAEGVAAGVRSDGAATGGGAAPASEVRPELLADTALARIWADSFARSDALRDSILTEDTDPATLLDRSLPGAAAGERAGTSDAGGAGASAPADGDTVGIAAHDGELSISLIQSLYSAFGSRCFDPRTGIVFQNRGSMFSLDPESPQFVRGRARPPHTLMPVIVTDAEGRPAIVQATMGGKAQAQIHARLFTHLVRGGTAEQAVALPRWVTGIRHPGDTPHTVHIEADVPAAVVEVLEDSTPEPLQRTAALTDWMGHANVIDLRGPAPAAASDPRADGSAWVG